MRPSSPPAEHLAEEEARRLLFLETLESADPAGEHLPMAARVAATRAGAGQEGLKFLIARADALEQQGLPPALAEARDSALASSHGWLKFLPVVLIAGAFLLGWATNELGPGRTVDILSFPLLGLMVWNLAVCVLVLMQHFRKSPPEKQSLASMLLRVPSPGVNTRASDAFPARVAAAFRKRWASLTFPAGKARAALVFHQAAIALAVGVVAGMYFRGLHRDYKATWESVFLDQSSVRKVLGAVLGPASLVSGVPLPTVPQEYQPDNVQPDKQLGEASGWMHLWATSALIFIILPRLIMANMARRSLTAAAVPWATTFAPWLETCRALGSERPQVALAVPVQIAPDSRLRDALRAMIRHLWGGQVITDFHASVAYGAEEEFVDSVQDAPSHLMLLFPLASTPEAEIHGWLVQECRRRWPGVKCIAVLDSTGFDEKMRALPEYERRRTERYAAWQKILGTETPLVLFDEAARRDPAAAARAAA